MMDALSAFLPIDRRLAMQAGQPLPDRVRGAALFADISGFTALTAALRHELGARRGAEEVITHVDSLYTALIEQVHNYGGNIIGFSGDAVTCWFDEPAGQGAPGAVERATACAFELQAVMATRPAITTPAGASIPLAIKVAVAAGPARRFLVGDPDAYVIEVLAGATLDRMAAAEGLARRGEVIVAPEVAARLGRAARVLARREADGDVYSVLGGLTGRVPPTPAPEPPALEPDVARRWLLPPVYEHLCGGAAEFLSELRPAVSLFARFSGIDYDAADDAGHKLDAFVRRAQAVLSHYEGYLLQITMGDKGSYIYASFGAPIAHENDPARAAAAALELRELPATLGYLHPLRVGLSSGLVHSGAYGSPQRRTYGVMGNQVNISSRLMSAAQPGQILISRRVAEALPAEFELSDLLPIALKGVLEPFPVAELRGRRAARTARAAYAPAVMVGRDTERALLDDAVERLAAGESLALFIEGAAGMGKSLLMQELVAKAGKALPTAPVLIGSGDAVERSTPYYGWRPVFERLFAIDGRFDAAAREAFLAGLDPVARPLAPLINSVLPLDLADNELTESMSGEARRENTQRLLIELLRGATAGEPLVLLFDDAQWLDSVSWSLVIRARREVEPILVAMVTRPPGEDPPPGYVELAALPSTQRIELDALPPPAIEALVVRRLGVGRLPPAITRLINEKAEGHPFFSEELAYALRDAGLLHVVDGEARLAPGADPEALGFPGTIQGVITSRIDRLPPSQQLTVKVASVIGRVFAVRVLSGIYPVPGEEPQLRENLKRLERLDITPQESPEPNLAYLFKHIVTQEVVYGLMTTAQRRQLHHNAALWYENAGEGDTARALSLLAHHWRLAGDAERAISYYERAGENAFRDYANQEAIRFFGQALALSGEATAPARRARWRRLMGEARYRLTQVESSVADYESALALLGHPVSSSAAARGLRLGRELLVQVAHRVAPNRLTGRAAPEEAAALLETARAYEGVAEIYYNLGDILGSFYCTMTAFNLAERAGPSAELARGYANMCATLGGVGINGPADSYRERAVRLAPAVDDPARAWIQIPLSIHSLWTANWDRSEAEIGEALAIYSRLGEWRQWCVAAWVWPQVAQGRGELERASGLWAELYAVAERSRDTRHQVRARGGHFFNALSLGRTDEALAYLAEVDGIMAENPEMVAVEERVWHGMRATAALGRGDGAAAADAAREQLAAIDRSRFKFDLLEVFAAPAEVFLALWERGKATEGEAAAGERALAGYARTYAFARPRALRLRGRHAWLVGKPAEARKQWEKSIAHAAALNMPYERALTLRAIGRYLGEPTATAEADRLLDALGCDVSVID